MSKHNARFPRYRCLHLYWLEREDAKQAFRCGGFLSVGHDEPPGYVRPSVYTSPQGPDPRIQQITRNVVSRMRRT